MKLEAGTLIHGIDMSIRGLNVNNDRYWSILKDISKDGLVPSSKTGNLIYTLVPDKVCCSMLSHHWKFLTPVSYVPYGHEWKDNISVILNDDYVNDNFDEFRSVGEGLLVSDYYPKYLQHCYHPLRMEFAFDEVHCNGVSSDGIYGIIVPKHLENKKEKFENVFERVYFE